MSRVALHTLGCKVNQYETQRIAEGFLSKGFDVVDFSDEADVYVINTCTVTRTADSKSRQAARSAIRRNPRATVVVTGCYAETSPEEVAKIHGVGMVMGNREKAGLVERVVNNLRDIPAAVRRPKREIENRTRALLKIQDGCDQFCAYCVVPLARPVVTSRPFAEVLAEASELARRGFKEIVLTGIRLGRYDEGLAELVHALTTLPGIERIRLSSIELTDIPAGLLDLVAQNHKICRHLHVPLQSGDDAVLARMKRPYTSADYESFVRRARSSVSGIAITTDIMVGFPGETAEEFDNTYRLAERMRFARAHVFPYSPRPRTQAAELPDDVSPAEKERRKTRLMDLAAECSHEFACVLVGKTVQVLVEGKEIGGNLLSGLTDNYVRTIFEADRGHVGNIVDVDVESVSRANAFGTLSGCSSQASGGPVESGITSRFGGK